MQKLKCIPKPYELVFVVITTDEIRAVDYKHLTLN